MTRAELQKLYAEIFKDTPLRSSDYHFSVVQKDIMKYDIKDEEVNRIFKNIRGTYNFISNKLSRYDVNLAFVFSIYCEAVLNGRNSYIRSDEFIAEINKFNNSSGISKAKDINSNPLLELNSLIGLANVKNEIKSLIALSKVQNEKKKIGMPSTSTTLHVVFKGNPGTGKTTVARMIGKIYYDLGLLDIGHVIEVSRHDLIARYIGHTAKVVAEKVEEAIGGILFIDEAYALTSYDNRNDFGAEAIQTLLKLMEDYRNSFAVIVAGYPNEMSLFLNSNPGFKSRFSTTIHFEDYTGNELLEILNLFVKQDELEFSPQALHKVTYLFSEKFDDKGTPSNARFVRNYYEAIIKRQAERLYDTNNLEKSALKLIEVNDIIDI